ncbi:MAG: TVP38/TMEM64 family protein [Leptolyngbyaceae cyanobacterium]
MNKLTRRIIGVVILIALIALPLVCLNRLGLDEETIRVYVEQMGIWAPHGLFTLRFTSVVIPALPSEVYSVLTGGLLGFRHGLVVVCLSDLLSCTLSFWLASTYGRGGVRRLVGDRFMYRVDRFTQKHLEQNFFLMTAFLMTGFFDFVAYGVGLARAPWRKFLPALVLSIAISNPPVVALGAGILAGQGQVFLVVFAVLGVFGLALLTGWLQRRTQTPKG